MAFDSLYIDMPISNYSTPVTLASHIGTSPSQSISPLRSRLDFNEEIQSNAPVSPVSPVSDSFFAGLGITYHQNHENRGEYTKDFEHCRHSIDEPIFHTLCRSTIFQSQRDDKLVDDEFNRLYQQELSSSWSQSCSMSGLASEANDFEHPPAKDVADYSYSKDVAELSFSSIAAASGISINLLAEHLSATANFTLRCMGDDFNSAFPPFSTSSGKTVGDELSSWPVIPECESEATSGTGNREDIGSDHSLGVNPAHTTTESPSKSDIYLEPVALPGTFLVSALQTHQLKEACQLSTRHEAPSPVLSDDNSGDYEDMEHYYSSGDSSPFPSPRPKKRTQISNHGKQDTKRVKQVATIETLSCQSIAVGEGEPSSLGINLGTPVLDAHRGVDIEEFEAKARRYRIRNPGRMFDNTWLVSFAGKLSSRGELVKEFRCYISGCSQTNKRRDHILIHVGSHLDQRPFACAFCPSQFFRKNECKRHELSHSGAKPFVCNICPDTAFVRQDLLKRHSARAHGIVTTRKRKVDREKYGEYIRVPVTKRAKRCRGRDT